MPRHVVLAMAGGEEQLSQASTARSVTMAPYAHAQCIEFC